MKRHQKYCKIFTFVNVYNLTTEESLENMINEFFAENDITIEYIQYSNNSVIIIYQKN
jgi:hypothetical protein